MIVDIQQPILLVTEAGQEDEAVVRLARVGYDNTIGYLEGGMTAWRNAGKDVDKINTIRAEEFATKFKNDPTINILDVRKPTEFAASRSKFCP